MPLSGQFVICRLFNLHTKFEVSVHRLQRY